MSFCIISSDYDHLSLISVPSMVSVTLFLYSEDMFLTTAILLQTPLKFHLAQSLIREYNDFNKGTLGLMKQRAALCQQLLLLAYSGSLYCAVRYISAK